MGDTGNNDEKYRLSDGKDAREILDCLETQKTYPSRENGTNYTIDDLEIVLMAANERWPLKTRGMLKDSTEFEDWQIVAKNHLRHGEGFFGYEKTWLHSHCDFKDYFVTGAPPDVRPADTIAQQFLHHVDALVAWGGEADIESHIAKAREAVLEGVPKGYRRKVLEKVLDREERALRESGASPDEVKALEEARDERRERGWQHLTGKGGKKPREKPSGMDR